MSESKPDGKPFAISKRLVWEAWRRVKANKGAAGVDEESIQAFEANLRANLYKVWNRMSSGSYIPPPVRAVELPKKSGGLRMLGVPTVADRVAQTVAYLYLEPEVEPVFHSDSYGYRPRRSAHDALGICRARCWKYDWAIDLDLRAFFDSLDHSLVLKAVAHHTSLRWILLYVERWLKAPLQLEDGTVRPRDRGSPQGSAISPVLANLFLHYALDSWLFREFPAVPFERYCDDGVPRTLKEDRCRRRYRRMRSCMRDGGWPSAVALQGEVANHREVRRSRAGVLSVAEKARRRARQVWITKASESEPPMKCRKRIDDIQNRGRVIAPGRVWREPADWPGGCPAWMVARAWSGLLCGTREPVAPIGRLASGAVVACGWSSGARTPSSRSARGRVAMRGTGADLTVVAMKAL
jgi:group II intron reverse transcriptase/maturase